MARLACSYQLVADNERITKESLEALSGDKANELLSQMIEDPKGFDLQVQLFVHNVLEVHPGNIDSRLIHKHSLQMAARGIKTSEPGSIG